MAIKVKCAKCGEELETPGGLLFSPPGDIPSRIYMPMSCDGIDICEKKHLCTKCYDRVVNFIEERNCDE